MINYFWKDKGTVKKTSDLEKIGLHDVLWVDLIEPSFNEKEFIEQTFNIELFTRQESREIESSSKYIEDKDEIGINLNFIWNNDHEIAKEPVSFIIKGKVLFTQRSSDYKTFSDTYRKIRTSKPEDGDSVFLTLLETRIDFDADLIEQITEQITTISKELVKENVLDREMLLRITNLQETTITIRENIVEKQRIISSIMKSKVFLKDDIENIRIMIKDVGSLLDHTAFNFERLEFLQNTFLGLVDMEQNRVIKLFTVVTVVFMPPTLIASMYGMNFIFMPELDEVWGYPLAIILMIFSSIGTLLYFRRKRWI